MLVVCVCVCTVFQYDVETDHLHTLELVEIETGTVEANEKTVRDLLRHLDLRPENMISLAVSRASVNTGVNNRAQEGWKHEFEGS